MPTFDKVDLQFILQQILMAENNQPATSSHLAFGLREVAGTDNNIVPGQGTFGAADQPFPTVGPQYFQTITVNIDGTVFDPNPGVAGDTMTTSYASTGPASQVVDTAPRTISNLIADQSTSNPAAVQASADFWAQLGDGYTVFSTNQPDPVTSGTADPNNPTNSLFIGNITPDAGLSAPFNTWMTLFGQFFDHGLDLINKGGAGVVLIPLTPDDPLATLGPDGIAGTGDEVALDGSEPAFMAVTRATVTVLPGADGVIGTADDVRQAINSTTPFVDQNQTYSSHPSHQVFLRDYQMGSDGKLHSTGKLLEGRDAGGDGQYFTADDVVNGGMATWAVVKANALKLGISLTDADVGSVPMLKTDDYGNLVLSANGKVQVAVQHGPGGIVTFIEAGDALNPLDLSLPDPANPTWTVVRTGHAFLDDIAHTAAPFGDHDGNPQTPNQLLIADDDDVAGGPVALGFYDDELLDAHYIAGDGRANENLGLTAVHEVFHSEHNRLLEQTKEFIRTELANGDMSFAGNWVLAGADLTDGIQENEWNGERLFQAAKFGTETQYQHLVFEEFARKIAPTIHLFGNVDIHLDAAITSEFANAVYRFGHSMLDEMVPRFELNPDGTPVIGPDGQPVMLQEPQDLISAFLNPLAYAARGTTAAAEIVQGTTHQIGNEIDEFVTGALRNNLLGLPLDLAAINIARGRDTGVPPINVLRHQLFEATGDTTLKPYANWAEFGQFLKHAGSLVNFVAAYGTHASILGATTLVDKRAAALDLVTAGLDEANQGTDAYDFMHSLGAYADDLTNPIAVHSQWSNGNITGLDNVDLWIGGLAEKQNLFGGLLGSTFNFIFETQLENLQDGDRLYYLPRIEGLHWGAEIEGNSFAEMIVTNTGAQHISGSIFLTPEYTVEAGDYFLKNPDGTFQLDVNGNRIATDPSTWLRNPVTGALLVEVLPDGTVHFIGDDNFFGNTMVLGGTDEADRLTAGHADDDTVWGDGGDDTIDGGNGNDILYGGTGNDTFTDEAGNEIIHGEEGNDIVNAGIGDDIVFGDEGDDLMDGGMGLDIINGGHGNDIIFGGEDDDELVGDEGDDWIAGGLGGDLIVGDHGAPTGQVPLIAGNDVLDGGETGDRMQGFSGDDIMLGLGGFDRFEGRLGYDWADFEQEGHGVDVDMNRRELIPDPQAPGGDAVRDLFVETEAVSGSAFNDILRGTSQAIPDPVFNELTNFDLIFGLKSFFVADPVTGIIAPFSDGNIMLGGDGNDTIEGREGNDIIDGDAWLHVELLPNETGEVGPGSQILREILYDLTPGDVDTAVFSDVMANYFIDLTPDEQGFITITHVPPAGGGGGGVAAIGDGVDRLRNIERLQFTDFTIATDPFAPGANQPPSSFDGVNPAVAILGDTDATTPIVDPVVGSPLTADIANLFDGDFFLNGTGLVSDSLATANLTYQWQAQDLARAIWVDINGATGVTYTPAQFFVGQALRVVVSYTDPTGFVEHIASLPTAVLNDAPAVNTAPIIVTQQGLVGLPDSSSPEDAAINLFLPVTRSFSDQQTPSNLLTFTATLANGNPLDSMGLAFELIPDTVNGGVLGARITGTPVPANFTGAIEIRVTATDAGQLSVTDVFRINVLPVNDPPVGVDDGYSVNEDGSLQVTLANSVLANDSDPEGNAITAQLVSGPANGTLALNANGTFTYTPFADFFGSDTFTYRPNDGHSLGNVTTVSIDVQPTQDPGTGEVTIASIDLNSPVPGRATLNADGVFTDPDGITGVSYQWQQFISGGIGWSNIAGAQGQSFSPDATLVGAVLRVQGTYTDMFGSYTYTSNKNVRVGDNTANTLNSSAQADILVGLGGDDAYTVAAGDSILEQAAGGVDTVRSAVIDLDLANYAFVENVTLLGSLALSAFGNDGNNVLRGDLAAGANLLVGRGGDDTYFLGTGDTVDESVAAQGGGTDTVNAPFDFVLGAGLENLTLSGTAISGTGNALGNLIIGNAEANIIDGGAGIDEMRGRAGADTYYVDDSGDGIVEGNNPDIDLVLAAATYTLSNNVENLTLLGSSNINGTGNGAVNVLIGNSGANVINGRQGNDVLTGGGGADQFVFNTALSATTNVDSITDFVVGVDKIALENAIFTALGANATLSSDAFNFGSAASDASDRILYDSATGDLFYDRDGTGGAVAVKFAHVAAGLSLTASDFAII